jgi:hypothetical protein
MFIRFASWKLKLLKKNDLTCESKENTIKVIKEKNKVGVGILVFSGVSR